MVSLLHAAFVAAISCMLKARFSGTDNSGGINNRRPGNSDATNDRANPLTSIKAAAQTAMKQTGVVNTSL